jgi:hypothetical protein
MERRGRELLLLSDIQCVVGLIRLGEKSASTLSLPVQKPLALSTPSG